MVGKILLGAFPVYAMVCKGVSWLMKCLIFNVYEFSIKRGNCPHLISVMITCIVECTKVQNPRHHKGSAAAGYFVILEYACALSAGKWPTYCFQWRECWISATGWFQEFLPAEYVTVVSG